MAHWAAKRGTIGIALENVNGEGSPTRRFLRLPDRGKLLIGTDLHGNWPDFSRLRARFLDQRAQGPCQLLLTGDLIHGPNFPKDAWPMYLGSYFQDRSGDVVEGYLDLEHQFPGEVHCLLGNHEHSHVGGPHTPKFWLDETMHFENTIGEERARVFNRAFARFPLLATAPNGIVITHAAPRLHVTDLSQLEYVSYDGFHEMQPVINEKSPPLMQLLWSRTCPPQVARQFLATLGALEKRMFSVVIFGHDVVSAGYRRIENEQLQLSTSFGLQNENKTYLLLDLERPYANAAEIREGHELLRLYAS